MIQLLLFHAGSLHGSSQSAQLSRLVWLYLHSGQQHYLEAVKALVLRCAQTRLNYLVTSSLSQSTWAPLVAQD